MNELSDREAALLVFYRFIYFSAYFDIIFAYEKNLAGG